MALGNSCNPVDHPFRVWIGGHFCFSVEEAVTYAEAHPEPMRGLMMETIRKREREWLEAKCKARTLIEKRELPI